MDAFRLIAERKIAEAISAGVLDGLPGAGQPLPGDSEGMLAGEQRMVTLILKNAGILPFPCAHLKELERLEAELSRISTRCRELYPADRMRPVSVTRPESSSKLRFARWLRTRLSKGTMASIEDQSVARRRTFASVIARERRSYLARLHLKNEKIRDLNRRCIEAEIRDRRKYSRFTRRTVDVASELGKFDRDFAVGYYNDEN